MLLSLIISLMDWRAHVMFCVDVYCFPNRPETIVFKLVEEDYTYLEYIRPIIPDILTSFLSAIAPEGGVEEDYFEGYHTQILNLSNDTIRSLELYVIFDTFLEVSVVIGVLYPIKYLYDLMYTPSTEEDIPVSLNWYGDFLMQNNYVKNLYILNNKNLVGIYRTSLWYQFDKVNTTKGFELIHEQNRVGWLSDWLMKSRLRANGYLDDTLAMRVFNIGKFYKDLDFNELVEKKARMRPPISDVETYIAAKTEFDKFLFSEGLGVIWKRMYSLPYLRMTRPRETYYMYHLRRSGNPVAEVFYNLYRKKRNNFQTHDYWMQVHRFRENTLKSFTKHTFDVKDPDYSLVKSRWLNQVESNVNEEKIFSKCYRNDPDQGIIAGYVPDRSSSTSSSSKGIVSDMRFDMRWETEEKSIKAYKITTEEKLYTKAAAKRTGQKYGIVYKKELQGRTLYPNINIKYRLTSDRYSAIHKQFKSIGHDDRANYNLDNWFEVFYNRDDFREMPELERQYYEVLQSNRSKLGIFYYNDSVIREKAEIIFTEENFKQEKVEHFLEYYVRGIVERAYSSCPDLFFLDSFLYNPIKARFQNTEGYDMISPHYLFPLEEVYGISYGELSLIMLFLCFTKVILDYFIPYRYNNMSKLVLMLKIIGLNFIIFLYWYTFLIKDNIIQEYLYKYYIVHMVLFNEYCMLFGTLALILFAYQRLGEREGALRKFGDYEEPEDEDEYEHSAISYEKNIERAFDDYHFIRSRELKYEMTMVYNFIFEDYLYYYKMIKSKMADKNKYRKKTMVVDLAHYMKFKYRTSDVNITNLNYWDVSHPGDEFDAYGAKLDLRKNNLNESILLHSIYRTPRVRRKTLLDFFRYIYIIRDVGNKKFWLNLEKKLWEFYNKIMSSKIKLENNEKKKRIRRKTEIIKIKIRLRGKKK